MCRFADTIDYQAVIFEPLTYSRLRDKTAGYAARLVVANTMPKPTRSTPKTRSIQ